MKKLALSLALAAVFGGTATVLNEDARMASSTDAIAGAAAIDHADAAGVATHRTGDAGVERPAMTALTHGDVAVAAVATGAAIAPLPAPAGVANSSRGMASAIEPADRTAHAQSKMSGPVAALAMTGGPALVDLVVSYADYPELFEGERVEELGGVVVRRYGVLDMLAIRIPAESLVELAVEDSVDRLSLDDAVTLTTQASTRAANVPLAESANSAFSGLGVNVAIVDTGIAQHADLGAQALQYSFLDGNFPQPLIENGEIVQYNQSPRADGYGHGTHVAGIVSGSGTLSYGQYRGPARDSKLLSLQVLDGNGQGQMSNVMAALDWLLQYGHHFDIRVVNLSLGKRITESNTTDPLVLAVEQLWDAGIVVVAAAGNHGRDGYFTITSPGNSRKIITVGSLTDNGTGTDDSDDYVSSFSSRGPTPGDFVLKPDLVAPGNRLVAAIPRDASLPALLPGRVVPCSTPSCEDDYLVLSGTSMAAPMVSAAAALMLQKNPALSPAIVKARLMRSARKLGVSPIEAGAGVLDIDAALDDTGTLAGEALSPLMIHDATTGGVLVQDTASLWGDVVWGAGYLWTDSGVNASGYLWTDSGVNASGYLWTDSNVWANGYLWTDSSVSANGYLWTDSRTHSQSLFDPTDENPQMLDDENE